MVSGLWPSRLTLRGASFFTYVPLSPFLSLSVVAYRHTLSPLHICYLLLWCGRDTAKGARAGSYASKLLVLTAVAPSLAWVTPMMQSGCLFRFCKAPHFLFLHPPLFPFLLVSFALVLFL